MKSTGNPKLDQIIATGKDLFWKFGVKRVTVEEICEEANVSKMTFYKYFTNKIELAETILDNFIGDALDQFEKLVDSDKSFQEKVQGMFIIKQDATKNISNEFINDLYKNKEFGLHLKMEKMSIKSMQIFAEFLEDSKKKNLIRKGVSIDFIIAYMGIVNQMIDTTNVLQGYDKVEDFIMEAMNCMFYGIIPIENR